MSRAEKVAKIRFHALLVVNLDGFNEVVLPVYENMPKQVYPFFPRN